MERWVSCEQESVLKDFMFRLPESGDPGHHFFIVISEYQWDTEPEGWKPTIIGPIHEDNCEQALSQTCNELIKLGVTVHNAKDYGY